MYFNGERKHTEEVSGRFLLMLVIKWIGWIVFSMNMSENPFNHNPESHNKERYDFNTESNAYKVVNSNFVKRLFLVY